MAKKSFTLRIDEDLYNKISAKSKAMGRSVNNYIVNLLEEDVADNLENRQIVGSIIKGDKISIKNNLLEVKGIYYKYNLINNYDVDSKGIYQVINSNGNVLTIQKLN